MNNEPLTDAQKQLISAWLDGETTPAETEQAAALARGPGAEYARSLRQLRVLVQTHGSAQVPVDLRDGVLKAIEPAPVRAMPTASWRQPLLALAAAVVVSLGLIFGPAMLAPDVPPPADMELARAPEAPAAASAEVEAAERTNDAMMDHADRAAWTAGPADNQGMAPADKGTVTVTPPSAPAPAPDALRRAERRDAEGLGGGSGGRVERARGAAKDDDEAEAERPAPQPGGDPAADAAPAEQVDSNKKGQEPEVVTLMLGKGRELAAQNDVLRVSALYGTATVLEDNGDLEDIEVEVDESRLAALVAALRRLNSEQDYGALSTPIAMRDETDDAPAGKLRAGLEATNRKVKLRIKLE